MKIAIISSKFSKKFGYSDNLLPKYLARLGHEVHLITSTIPPYSELPEFDKTYGNFINETPIPDTFEHFDGFTIHYLDQKKMLNYPRLKGLIKKLLEIKPDVIQTLQTISWIPTESVIAGILIKSKIFTENHTHVSVFPLAQNIKHKKNEFILNFFTRYLNGFLISFFIKKCYAITDDCAFIANEYFGIHKKKIKISELGVDSDYFNTIDKYSVRATIRERLQIKNDKIVCIYTGRFTHEKNPLLLAQAIEKISSMNKSFHGIFIGEGVQSEEIKKCKNCIVIPFMHYSELNNYYKASDIAVWPTQESMSMLDAAACGLPLIVNNTLIAKNRIDGNGLFYLKNNLDSLIDTILKLENNEYIEQLGRVGAEKMKLYSWTNVVLSRMKDYSFN